MNQEEVDFDKFFNECFPFNSWIARMRKSEL